jgi:hypothetical protein
VALQEKGNLRWGYYFSWLRNSCLSVLVDLDAMNLKPLHSKEAMEFIAKHHRHHLPPQGWKFGIGLMQDNKLVGVITVGRPVSRRMDDGYTAEVTRCCLIDGIKNGCSMLYGAAWRAARAMGYHRIITYILASESGISLKASGYKILHEVKAQSWDKPSRHRTDKTKVCNRVAYYASGEMFIE